MGESVDALGFVGNPVLLLEDAPFLHLRCEPVVDVVPAHGDLIGHFGADEDLQVRRGNDVADEFTEFGHVAFDELHRDRLLAGVRPVEALVVERGGRPAEPGDDADEFFRFQSVLAEESLRRAGVLQFQEKGAVGGEGDLGAGHPLQIEKVDRNGVPAENEGSLGKQFLQLRRPHVGGAVAVEAVGFARLLFPEFNALGVVSGARAVDEKVAEFEGAFPGLLGVGDDQFGVIPEQHFPDAPVDLAGPQVDLALGQPFPGQFQKARRMGDVADVPRLPAASQQDPFLRAHFPLLPCPRIGFSIMYTGSAGKASPRGKNIYGR